MVQILPQKTNVGSQIGQALGLGLQQGFGKSLPMQYERGLLQEALGKVKNLSNQKNADPVSVLTSLMEAGAGIPGSERYLGQLAPLLLGSLRTKNLFGEGGVDESGRLVASNPAQASQIASKFIEGEQPSGYLSAPMNPDQVHAYATEYARALNDPDALNQGLAQANAINQTRLQSRQIVHQGALEQGIEPAEIPRFMQFATQFQESNDLPTIIRAATDATKQLRNQKNALENIETPSTFQNLGGIKSYFVPGMTIYKALTSKGAIRQKALKGYEELVRGLVNQGEEPYVRETLAEKGLSPTEVEELIHPLSQDIQMNIRKLPRGNQLNSKSRGETLANFFRSNLDNDSSLLVLRDHLINERGYDWEEIRDAIKTAFPNADNLTRYQSAELSSLAKPPIQSLSQIFIGSTPNLRGFLRGQK